MRARRTAGEGGAHRGIEAIEEVAGVLPRLPGAGRDLSRGTLELLVEYGFAYDSSLMGHDFAPYYARIGDRVAGTSPSRWERRSTWSSSRSSSR